MQTGSETSRPRVLTDPSDVRHLQRRLAFVAGPAQERALRDKPVEEAIDALFKAAREAPAPVPPDFARTVWINTALRYPETSSKEYQDLRAAQSKAQQAQIEQLRQWWLREMSTTAVPLRETLLLFFHGTLGSFSGTADMPQAVHGTNALMRRACLGTIPALLEEVLLDPGMMIQISMDEHRHRKDVEFTDRPGRMILESWTVGARAFSDKDAMELSRALTGWVTVPPPGYEPTRPPDPTTFRSARRTGLVPIFEPEYFDAGPKTILGTTGSFDAKSAIRFLALHPSTARRSSRLLIAHFGVVDAETRLEARLVETYQTTGGSVRALVDAIVLSDEFWSPASRWSLIKSPVHLAVGACRQLGLAQPPLANLSRWLTASGQKLFDTPDFGASGWPGGNAWVRPVDRLAVRYQLPLALSGQALRLGIAAAPASRARADSNPWSALKGLSSEAMLTRLDPAPGIDLRGRAGNGMEVVRSVMATPQYQLA